MNVRAVSIGSVVLSEGSQVSGVSELSVLPRVLECECAPVNGRDESCRVERRTNAYAREKDYV